MFQINSSNKLFGQPAIPHRERESFPWDSVPCSARIQPRLT